MTRMRIVFVVGAALLLSALGCALSDLTVDPTSPPPTQTPPPTSEPAEAEPTEAEPTSEPVAAATPSRELVPEELQWGGFGGGSSDDAACGDGVPSISIDTYDSGDPSTSAYEPSNGHVGLIFSIQGCDYTPGDEVEVMFYLPDGSAEGGSFPAPDDGKWRAGWLAMPDEPTGQYSVEVTSGDAVLSETFVVTDERVPELVVACPNDTENLPGDGVLLAGFAPGEVLLLAHYAGGDRHGELLDTWYVTTGEDGSAITQVPSGMASGAVYVLDSESQISPDFIDYVDWDFFKEATEAPCG